MNKLWACHKQLINKSQISHKQVEIAKSLASHAQVMSNLTFSMQVQIGLVYLVISGLDLTDFGWRVAWWVGVLDGIKASMSLAKSA